jgi:hypothetical protein|tara:strand:+ start:135 stop:458 length:324 start_codon:yes stop_codon:yes gene_type:complete
MAENKDKKVIFSDTHIRHAQLRIRLDNDGFSQSEFFRCIVSGYLEQDRDLMEYVKKYKTEHKVQSKRKMKYIEKDQQKSEDLMGQFGIKDGELENIFDLIAEEHPDL